VHGTVESRLRVEWRPLGGLDSVAAQWRQLAGRALEPNVFYEPAFAQAAAPVFGGDVQAGLVWSDLPPRLVGFFPARVERRRYGVPLPVLTGWTHPYAPLGVPLVDRELAEAVIAAWCDDLAGQSRLPRLMLLPYLPLEGPLAQALAAVIARRGGRSATFARHARALLAPAGDRHDYLDHALGHKKRKELRRQRKRLADAGVVSSSSAHAPATLEPALADFLTLEASGWKGRAGTAARTRPEVCAFLQAAVTALAGEGKAGIDRLSVDTRPIAAIVTLTSGPAAWCWKTAYDETFALFSPGVQLLLDVTQRLLDDPAVMRADSCATPNHPLIDHVWRERLVLGDRLLCTGPEHAAAFTLACGLESLRRALIDSAKALRGIVKKR
jgi:CelD/BcsL family acetyltransferase involved in cellulose biosynthesis